MEFLDLGKHCSEATCKQLDFLPLKCDACEDVFCKDHITYVQHRCASAYKKDVQVPVCPLCGAPVPMKRGEKPDIVVGQHIDRNCTSDLSNRKQKIFTNRCCKTGCKKKELMKITCDQCHNNFCLSHRHPLDHDCKSGNQALSKAGHAALNRSVKTSHQNKPTAIEMSRPVKREPSSNYKSRQKRSHVPEMLKEPGVDIHSSLSEDEALQRALELSLQDVGINDILSSPEDDLELTQALAASREEYRRFQLKAVKATGK
ncbi:AN1-type zinc finger protein 2A [Rhinophrynus dorsalis]